MDQEPITQTNEAAKPGHKKAIFIFLIFAAGIFFAAAAFWTGVQVGKQNPEMIAIRDAYDMRLSSDQRADFSTFWQAWDVINSTYLRNKDVKGVEKVQGAIKGLVLSLKDPYTEYFKPADNKKFQEDIKGNFGGIGIQFGIRKGQLVVIAPLKDTPAAKAGLKAGDQILKINASSTDDMSTDEASTLIRGPVGTKVNLTIFRAEWDKPKDVPIIRGNIEVPTLDYTLKDGGIGYVQLYGFTENAGDLFAATAKKMQNDKVKGIVLDLRDNPGGYLEVAVDVAGWLIPEGKLIVSEKGRGNGVLEAAFSGDSEQNDEKVLQEFKANGPATLAAVPLVVLINKGSASASEILAGALRDNRKIKLIGEQSFGKGTVQELKPLKDGSSIKLTIAHWVLPSGHVLENEGLKADIEAKLTDDDIKAEKDPQLDAALSALKAQIK